MKVVETTRRRMLMALAAASSAAATGVSASAKGAAKPENPELIRLAEITPEKLASYRRAYEKERSIIREFSPKWPCAPEEILGVALPFSGNLERSLTGAAINRVYNPHGCKSQEVPRVFEVHSPQSIKNAIAGDKRDIERILRTKTKRRLAYVQDSLAKNEAALPLSEAYVSECERITKASGIKDATKAKTAAR